MKRLKNDGMVYMKKFKVVNACPKKSGGCRARETLGTLANFSHFVPE